VLGTPFIFASEAGSTRSALGGTQSDPIAHFHARHSLSDRDYFPSVFVSAKKGQSRFLLSDEGSVLPGTNGGGTNFDEDFPLP
jgi:hypothetical protein